MAGSTGRFNVEEPKWEQIDGRTEEECFRDYTTELENWAFSMETAEWVLETDDGNRALLSGGKSPVVRKRNQMTVWTHLFKTFKTSPKGK
eukprot:3187007-Rhodomonas_salina.1